MDTKNRFGQIAKLIFLGVAILFVVGLFSALFYNFYITERQIETDLGLPREKSIEIIFYGIGIILLLVISILCIYFEGKNEDSTFPPKKR